jgi:hypothetical protein
MIENTVLGVCDGSSDREQLGSNMQLGFLQCSTGSFPAFCKLEQMQPNSQESFLFLQGLVSEVGLTTNGASGIKFEYNNIVTL